MAGPAGPIALIAIPVLIVGGLIGAAVISEDACDTNASTSIDASQVPDTVIDGFGHAQLVNAAHIIQAGADLNLSTRDQTIGVMTAIGESSLRILDYGDTAGPDSRGLFQQRDNWGPLADRMDPYKSATMFFQAMIKAVPETERASLAPTIVAHRTQINADPYHYERFWASAEKIVAELAKTSKTNGQSCPADGTTNGTVGKDGWAKPGDGPVNGHYGYRDAIPGVIGAQLHTGLDLEAGGCNGPIWSAHDGTVTNVAMDGLGNWFVDVDHGGNVLTRYVHMYRDGILVSIGDKKKAGQQIARTGSSGASTGCHLHFEVIVDGDFTNPEPFLAERGITY